MIKYIVLLVGFAVLIKGADYFVDAASNIAKKFNIPSLVIGLTIVAFGTSVPEASVGISAALSGSNGLVLGNVIGSNIFNLLCAAGITAIIKPIRVQSSTILKEFPLSLLSTFVLFVIAFDIFFDGGAQNVIGVSDGIILLLVFGVFLYYITELAFSSKEIEENQSVENSDISITKNAIQAVLGALAIVIGGSAVVDAASLVAQTWGMSQELIGLTIVAIGTSLPELVTSVVAAKKGESDIAIGNIIGSCLFNILFILGISSIINPIEVSTNIIIDIGVLLSITVMAYLFSITKKEISKKEGMVLFITYVGYMAYIIARN